MADVSGILLLTRLEQHMMATESDPRTFLSEAAMSTVRGDDTLRIAGAPQDGGFRPSTPMSAVLSQVALLDDDLSLDQYFPQHQFDVNNQQLDLRSAGRPLRNACWDADM